MNTFISRDGIIYTSDAGEMQLAQNGLFDGGREGYRIHALSEHELSAMSAAPPAPAPEPALDRSRLHLAADDASPYRPSLADGAPCRAPPAPSPLHLPRPRLGQHASPSSRNFNFLKCLVVCLVTQPFCR
jgi:hypothetical protein